MREAKRIYYLDFIRAIAMIAGIFFHASLSFLKDPANLWPVHDPQISSGVIDLFTWASHRIRMPLFFIVCGFFSFMLIKKYTLKDFIKNRIKKILIPFLISLVVIVPITIDSFIIDGQFIPYASSRIQYFSLMHLWFLYYLIIFYIILLVFKNKIFSCLNNYSRVKDLLFIILIAALIFSMKNTASINPSPRFIPDLVSLCFYFTFYILGIYFFKHPNIFKSYYNKKTFFISFITLITSPLLLLLKLNNYNTLLNISTTLFTISSLVITIELSRKLFNKDSKIIRYISDSSYWLYLIHIPIVVTLQKHLLAVNIPKEFKFLVTSIITLVITLISYQIAIRYTPIGTFLHGKRRRLEFS